jgi:hypothetical protein
MKKILKITIISILSLVLLVFGSISLGIVYTNYRPRMDPIIYESVDPDYWPVQKWQTSTLEDQGMNSNRLIEMVEFYEKEHAKNENISPFFCFFLSNTKDWSRARPKVRACHNGWVFSYYLDCHFPGVFE